MPTMNLDAIEPGFFCSCGGGAELGDDLVNILLVHHLQLWGWHIRVHKGCHFAFQHPFGQVADALRRIGGHQNGPAGLHVLGGTQASVMQLCCDLCAVVMNRSRHCFQTGNEFVF